MAQTQKFDDIVGNFRAGILSPAMQDNIQSEVYQQGAAAIRNFRIEKDGGITGRTPLRRIGLEVETPTHGVLSQSTWRSDCNTVLTLDLRGSAKTGSTRFEPGTTNISRIYEPGNDGIYPINRRFTISTAAVRNNAATDVFFIELGGAPAQAITFHGVRLEQGRWIGPDDSNQSFQRLTFDIFVQPVTGSGRSTFVRQSPITRNESPFTVGAFVPGILKRDITIPLDVVANVLPAPIAWIAIRLRRRKAAIPITLVIEGISCFTSNRLPQSPSLGNAVPLPDNFFRTPARIIPWQIRNQPFIIVLAMDWCAWGQLGGDPRWRVVSLSAWHFTERQLRELTWSWYSGNLLLFHRDFPMPLQVRLPTATNTFIIEPLILQNIPRLDDQGIARILPDILDADASVSLGAIRSGSGAAGSTVPPSGFFTLPGEGLVTVGWLSTTADRYNVYFQTADSLLAKVNDPAITGDAVWAGAGVDSRTTDLTSIDITGLVNGTEYAFVVRSVVGAAEGPFSDVVNATPREVLASATNLAGVSPFNMVDGNIGLTWDAVPNATGYVLAWASWNGLRFVLGGTITNISATSYTFTGTSGVLYEFALVAVDSSNTRSNSAPVTLIQRGRNTPPMGAADVLARSGFNADGHVEASWTRVPTASGYEMEYQEKT